MIFCDEISAEEEIDTAASRLLLRVTCAGPAHGHAIWLAENLNGFSFLLGHASVETTERYLGCQAKTQRGGGRYPRSGKPMTVGHAPQADFWRGAIAGNPEIGLQNVRRFGAAAAWQPRYVHGVPLRGGPPRSYIVLFMSKSDHGIDAYGAAGRSQT
jgi:hypothetical protein